jgi:transcriptional regulator with PAS, ATPase and Fis domain
MVELSQYQLEKYCRRLGKDTKFFSEDVKEAFNKYNWPGNVRELENVVEYLVNIVRGEEITLENLPYNIKEYLEKNTGEQDSNQKLKDALDKYEKEILESYLKAYGNTTEDKERISEMLGINLSTLYRKLNKYNLQ